MSNNNSGKQSVRINVNDLPVYVCEQCQREQFVPVFSIRAISAITSPNGQAGALHQQTGFMCTHCGWALPIQEIANQCKEQIENEKPLLVSPKES
jgi:hypothetical protein